MQNRLKGKIIDISLPLNTGTITYPGNPEIKIQPQRSASGSSIISQITMGSHSGTHIDAPLHVFENGLSVDKLPLEVFVGSCRVLDLTTSEGSVLRSELEQKNIKAGERILLKTNNSMRGFKEFYNDYVYLSSEGAEYLAEKEVSLVGIDFLSIKQRRGSSDNTSHTALLSKNIPILEGLNLAEVTEGEYTLVALPLPFTNLDGSPVRAVLLKS